MRQPRTPVLKKFLIIYSTFASSACIGDIDVSQAPNHEQLFAQALNELDHGASSKVSKA